MDFFARPDLHYSYEWTTEENDPRLHGEPDHSLFNPNEGREVLYVINQFGKKHKAEVPVIGIKAERLIKVGLPAEIRTQKEAVQWLEQHWAHV